MQAKTTEYIQSHEQQSWVLGHLHGSVSRLKQCQTPPPPPQAWWQFAWISKSIQQLLDFTSNFSTPPQSQGKATAEKQASHHATGHQLDHSELFFKRVFSSYNLCRKLHPSLSPFLLSPTSYSFNFLEANRKGSQSLQEGHLPRRFCPPSDSHPSSSAKLRKQSHSSQPGSFTWIVSELWASRLTAEVKLLLRDTQGHRRKDSTSEDLSPIQALSAGSHAVGAKMCIPRDLHPSMPGPDHPRWHDVSVRGWPWYQMLHVMETGAEIRKKS